jgi:hypothetical protein
MVWNIEYYPAAVAAGSGNGVSAGVFIPRTNLPGITTATELSDSNKERKVAYSVLNKSNDALNLITNKLGITNARSSAVGILDRINQTFSSTFQFAANHASNTLSMVPLPTSNDGLVTIANLFANAEILVAEDDVPSAGIVIPTALITAHGGTVPGSITVDARSFLNALYASITLNLEPNTAVISVLRGTAVGFTPPTNFTGTGAITGILEAALPQMSFYSVSYSVTLQIALNQESQTFDLAG